MIIERICKQSGLTPAQLEWYAQTASKRYKVFPIPKKNGDIRIVSQPSRELKALQRWLIRSLVKDFPVHQSSTAYVKGGGIRANADRHAATNFTLRLDFEDFFPSFTSSDVTRFLKRRNEEGQLGLTESDIYFMARIFTRFEMLTIGAPSSPMLTNCMMYDFDHALSTWVNGRGAIYTRYADDIFVSSRDPKAISGTVEVVRSLGRTNGSVVLKVNESKTAFMSKKRHRSVTGLVITPDHSISIGRDRKRKIRTLVHSFVCGKIEIEDLSYLRGMLAFISDVEPAFRWSLIKKYGIGAISEIEQRSRAS